MKSIGSKIRQLAEMNSLTVADIARRLGKSKQALYEMINKDDVNTKVLRDLCEWYNVPITFFFTNEPGDSYAKERITDMNKDDKNRKASETYVVDLDAVLKRGKQKGWSKEDIIYYSLITPDDYAMIEQRKTVDRRVMVLLCKALDATEDELTYKEKEAQSCKIDTAQMRAIGKRFDTIDEQFDLITKDIHKLSSMLDSIVCALGRLESVAEVLRLSGVTKETLDKAVEQAVLDIAVLTDHTVPTDGKVPQNEIEVPSQTDDAPAEETKPKRKDGGKHVRKGAGLPTETVREMKVGDVIYVGYDNLSDFRSKRYSAMWASRNFGYTIEARMSDKEKRVLSITRLS